MNNKVRRILALLTAAVLIAAISAVSVSAAGNTPYTDPETGYRVVIIDELDLLTDEEETKLVQDMRPITRFGNVAFWTTEETTYNEIDQARIKRKELFEYDSATIFAINMDVRKLTVQSYGTIYDSVSDSLARSITSNASSYASKSNYYACASEVYSQINRVLEGDHIPEPMKISSYVIISVMAGLVFAILIALGTRSQGSRKQNVPSIMPMGVGTLTGNQLNITFVRKKTRVVQHSSCSSGGCSSGSSCGGGGCSSGSSCGGGGCGGGGSSSF